MDLDLKQRAMALEWILGPLVLFWIKPGRKLLARRFHRFDSTPELSYLLPYSIMLLHRNTGL